MKAKRLSFLFVIPLTLAACAQQEEAPPPIQGQPVFNKMGEVVGCEQGVYVPGAAAPNQCYIPDDECDPQYSSVDPDCVPPGRDPQDSGSRDPEPVTPNNPTGAATFG